jgi:hypothetical protein
MPGALDTRSATTRDRPSMNPAHVRYLLPCLVAGCAVVAPPAPVAPPAAEPAPQVTAPTAPEPSARPPTPVEQRPAVRAPQPPAAAAKPPATSAPAAPATRPAAPPAAASPQPPAAPPLDLNALKQQLKDTNAIGVMTKLSLKNQVDDLLQAFRDYYDGRAEVTLPQLRRSYDALLMKVLTLVQDNDTKLARSIVASREPIWGLLSDPKKFAALQV